MVSLPKFVRERVVWGLGPGHPGLLDGEVAKVRVHLLPDTVQMILVLVRDDDQIELTARGLSDVFDDVADLVVMHKCGRSWLVSTVDEHIHRMAAILTRQRQKKAVTMPLAVHPHCDAILRWLKLGHSQVLQKLVQQGERLISHGLT